MVIIEIKIFIFQWSDHIVIILQRFSFFAKVWREKNSCYFSKGSFFFYLKNAKSPVFKAINNEMVKVCSSLSSKKIFLLYLIILILIWPFLKAIFHQWYLLMRENTSPNKIRKCFLTKLYFSSTFLSAL